MAIAWHPRWDVGSVRRRSVRRMRPGTQRCCQASSTRPADFVRRSWRGSAQDSRVEFRGGDTTPRKGRRTRMGRRSAHPPATRPARRRRPDGGSAVRGSAQVRVLAGLPRVSRPYGSPPRTARTVNTSRLLTGRLLGEFLGGRALDESRLEFRGGCIRPPGRHTRPLDSVDYKSRFPKSQHPARR